MKVTYYQILGVEKNASAEVIKKAYKKRVSQYHPDRSDHPHATELMTAINVAYTCLSDSSKRNDYDKGLIPAQPRATQQRTTQYSSYTGEQYEILERLRKEIEESNRQFDKAMGITKLIGSLSVGSLIIIISIHHPLILFIAFVTAVIFFL